MSKKEKPATKLCKHCQTEIPYAAKVCPNCRKKVKGGILKWIILAIVIMIAIGSIGGNNSDTSSTKNTDKTSSADVSSSEQEAITEIVYNEYKCTDLFDELDKNALAAEKKHQDEYVEISGYLSVIDSDGKYISVGGAKDDYDHLFQTIRCKVTNDTQLDQILEMEIDQKITVKGQITSIGEVLGYELNMVEITN